MAVITRVAFDENVFFTDFEAYVSWKGVCIKFESKNDCNGEPMQIINYHSICKLDYDERIEDGELVCEFIIDMRDGQRIEITTPYEDEGLIMKEWHALWVLHYKVGRLITCVSPDDAIDSSKCCYISTRIIDNC